jgi:DNA-directed RNA polymerase subunit RPC12/RpoP
VRLKEPEGLFAEFRDEGEKPEMIGEIAAIVTATKGTLELLKAAKGSKDLKVNSAALEQASEHLLALQGVVMQAHIANLAQGQEIEDLKRQIMALQDWDAEAKTYQLAEVTPGVFAYALKPDQLTSEVPHYLCANCFQKRQKSILQLTMRLHLMNTMDCHSCSSRITLSSRPSSGGPVSVPHRKMI